MRIVLAFQAKGSPKVFGIPNVGVTLNFKNFMEMGGVLSGLVCLNYCKHAS